MCRVAVAAALAGSVTIPTTQIASAQTAEIGLDHGLRPSQLAAQGTSPLNPSRHTDAYASDALSAGDSAGDFRDGDSVASEVGSTPAWPISPPESQAPARVPPDEDQGSDGPMPSASQTHPSPRAPSTSAGTPHSPSWVPSPPGSQSATPRPSASAGGEDPGPQRSPRTPTAPPPSSPHASRATDGPGPAGAGTAETSPGWPTTPPQAPSPVPPAAQTPHDSGTPNQLRQPRAQEEASRSSDSIHVTVKRGDSLWKIVRRTAPHLSTHRTAELVDQVYRHNRREIGPDPNLIMPGQRLEIP